MAKPTKKDAAQRALNEAAKRQHGQSREAMQNELAKALERKKREEAIARAEGGGKSYIGRQRQTKSGSGKSRIDKDDTIGGKYRGSDR